jgi:DNA-binding response OmpR family regulator
MDNQPQPLILIVDDDDSIRMLLKMAIKNKGYQIEEATNGEEAIAVYQRCQPNLVILDAIMPIMDGFQTCKHICDINEKNHQETPILMLTFLDDQESIDKAFSAGATDYITKPIHWAVLFQRVKRLLTAANDSLNVRKMFLELTKYHNYDNIICAIVNETEYMSQSLLNLIRVFFEADITIFFNLQNNSYCQSNCEDMTRLELEEIKKINLIEDYQTEYQKGKIIIINNSSEENNINPESLSILNKLKIKYCVIEPIVNKNKLIGLLGFYKIKSASNWQEEELKRLKILSNLLALKNKT